MSLAVDRRILKLWLPLTKNAKNRGSKDVITTVYGDLIYDAECDTLAPFPSYAYFDNACFIHADGLNNITNFTISWWEKPKTTVEMLDSWSLFLSGDEYITLYKTDTPKLSCFIKDSLYEPTFLDDKGNPVTNVCDGYWHFYALTYKLDENNGNNVFTLYKDTDFIGTAILGKEEEPLTFKGLNIGIVTNSKGASTPFNGYICDFRMYDYYMGIREIREKLAYNKKFDFMARSEEFSESINKPKPIFYDNSGINLFKLVSEKTPIIHGNSVVFNGDSRLTIYADSKGGNEGLNMEKGFLSAWFIPYEPNKSIIFIDTSSGMALGIYKDKSGNYKLLINCGEQPLETSFENIKFDTINNVIIEYDKLPIRVIVNGIQQSIDSSDVSPFEKVGFCIGGTTKEDCSFFGEILKISIYGANCDSGFLEYCYRPTLNMLKSSLASTLQTDLKFEGSQYTIIDLFSSELPNESVKFVFYFTTEIREGQKDMCLMHFASQGFGIKLYYGKGPCVGVKIIDKLLPIGQFTVNEENKLSIEIKDEECICQLNNDKPVVSNVGNLLEGLTTHNDKIIIGANKNYDENYSGYLNVLKIYYDDILSRKLICAENYKRGLGLYDIKTDRWYFLW